MRHARRYASLVNDEFRTLMTARERVFIIHPAAVHSISAVIRGAALLGRAHAVFDLWNLRVRAKGFVFFDFS